MNVDEIVKYLQKESSLRENDYFESGAFYYLAGRFPDLTVREAAEAIDCIRQYLLQK